MNITSAVEIITNRYPHLSDLEAKNRFRTVWLRSSVSLRSHTTKMREFNVLADVLDSFADPVPTALVR